jgi:hypothetical protein
MPRLEPGEPFPPYTFIPGRTPHPVRDPAGHMHGCRSELPPPLDPASWQESRAYRRGIDLFNCGYYWEAHETWEGLWNRAGRQGVTADFLKGLIKLAAAGVKVREGVPPGVAAHAAGAAELFRQVAEARGGADACFAGLRLGDLIDFTAQAEGLASTAVVDDHPGVRVVFGFVLQPAPAVAP